MGYPRRRIVGKVFTSGGDLIISGNVIASLIPPGATVLDDVVPTQFYKVTAREEGIINTIGVQSFYLTPMDSMNPADAIYQIRWDIHRPVQETWWEFWRITGVGQGDLDVGDIIPVQYGPYLPEAGYAPIVFTVPTVLGGGGDSFVTIVESLPTVLTASMHGKRFLHDRRPNNLSDEVYDVGRDSSGNLTLVYQYTV